MTFKPSFVEKPYSSHLAPRDVASSRGARRLLCADCRVFRQSLGKLVVLAVAACVFPSPEPTTANDSAAATASPSRAAWCLAQDGVEPIADLINTAGPGAAPKFADRVGNFQVRVEDRALLISGTFPQATIWRFDLTTFDGQFDMRKLYVPHGNCAFPDDRSIGTRAIGELLGDPEKGRTYTGPWEIFNGRWLVPTARVALDGEHVYTSWFDLPSLEDQRSGRVYASFALEIATPGRHTVRVSFDDFAYGTRWREPRWRSDTKPPVTYGRNDLRPHHVGSVAIGIDERVRMLEAVSLKPALRGKHPRLDHAPNTKTVEGRNLSIADVEPMLIHVDPDRGELWEYSIDAESMASENDMDAGRKGAAAAAAYDLHVARLSPQAKAEWDRLFHERFDGLYTFFVFQRNYHPTGYAQNHSAATVPALLAAGLVWDGPDAEKWLRWGVMTCRKRVELFGRDGGLEWMNEGRSYGLDYSQQPIDLIRHGTGLDITRGERFFENEWRYALHHAVAFPSGSDRRPLTVDQHGQRGGANPNVPVPPQNTPQNTPTNWHFADVDQVFMRSDWSDDAYRARLWAGSVFGHQGAPIAKRYNWAHCRVNQGSFVLGRGDREIILEPGRTRTYRKSAANNNCILVNDTDQWGGGQVWHPRLRPDQIARIAFFADGMLLGVARCDLIDAYPPAPKLNAISRCLLHVKPDRFLVFDRVETEGLGKAEWRFHAAFIEPAGTPNRFTAFGFEAADGPMKDRSASYDAAFRKAPEVRCEIALLTPGAEASIATSDVYYRWSPFSRPQRHLKVVQQSDRPMTLLTAFGPELAIETKGNTHRFQSGGVRTTILLGGGTTGDLQSDAHLAVAVQALASGRVEVMRFGGSRLTYGGVGIASEAEDVLAVIKGGEIVEVEETKATEPSGTGES